MNYEEIYLGDGIYDLELFGNVDSNKYFRWFSDNNILYVIGDNIKLIKLNIISEIDNECEIINKNEIIKIKLNIGDNVIEIKNAYGKLQFNQNYFIPKILYKTSDERKLSFKLMSIDIIYENKLRNKTYNIKDIKFITEDYYNNIINKNNNTDVEISGLSIYGEMYIKYKNNNERGKINLNNNQIAFYSHRAGWNYVLNGLFKYHNNEGINFDGFLENAFIWRKEEYITNNIIPYKKPWIGIFHSPPNMPSWFSDNGAYPSLILKNKYFLSSLNNCKGLFVLSQYHANYLKIELPQVPVNILKHPTEVPCNIFNFEKFLDNKNKKIINIGWWLRKLNSFYLLKSPYKKIRLLPNNKCKDSVFRLMNIERVLYDIKLNEEQINSVKLIDYVNNEYYDELLSKNIVFLDLYDSSANNAIIECIARGTPILINKLQAVVEYLGEDYPFYFENYNDAEEKLNNIDLIFKTHKYLMEYDGKNDILIETFLENFENSFVYKNL